MPSFTLDQFKSALSSQGLEDQFLKLTGLTSMNELSPANFTDNLGKADSFVKTVQLPDSSRQDSPPMKKEDADAKPTPQSDSASDFLYGYKTAQILYPPRKKAAFYAPSAYMMFFIIHELNSLLCEHFYFKRAAPNYHPVLLRVYFGIVFFVQSLRAQQAANALKADQYQFLDRFLDSFPPETLPIPACLIHVFKSLCTSKSELPQFGFIAPFIPKKVGNEKLESGPLKSATVFTLPNVPALLSLYHLTLETAFKSGKTLRTDLKYEKGTEFTFAGIKYDKDNTKWEEWTAWALISPGIEHAVEGTKDFHKNFKDNRAELLDIPKPSSSDNVSTVSEFLFLDDDVSWFQDLIEMAAAICKFSPGSGTLADCSTQGPPISQIQTVVTNGTSFSTKPDGLSNSFKFWINSEFKLESTNRGLDQMSMIMAAASQLNMKVTATGISFNSQLTHDVWKLGPIESSQTDSSSHHTAKKNIQKMLLDKSK